MNVRNRKSIVLRGSKNISGIWLVGNIGRERGSILWPLLGCYLTVPLFIWGGVNTNAVTSFAGILMFNWKSKQWKKFEREALPVWKRILILSLCGNVKRCTIDN